MAKKDERFIKVLNEGSTWTTNREIWVDKTTGVNYLWIASGYAGGLNKKIALLGIEGIDVDALSMPKKGVAL